MAEICVIGAGPAGSIFAARMAQLGHRVLIVERSCFPRRHLGESLSPGVLPLLEMIGSRAAVEGAGFTHVRRVLVKWDTELQVRQNPREEGLLVDRGRFDQILLERARALGVHVLQPARVGSRSNDEWGWNLLVMTQQGAKQLRADFLADAGGRSSSTPRRRSTGCRTVALYAYWRGSHLPQEPRIEAGEQAWYWGIPLPDGTYNTIIFADVKEFRARCKASLATHFLDLLGHSGLMIDCRNPQLTSPVLATDATSYLHDDCVTPSGIRVGEAALAIDAVSSSGVQKAIQNALAAAVVANTLLRRPARSEQAMRFYRENLSAASTRHSRWATSYYARVAARGGGRFWRDRGKQGSTDQTRVSQVESLADVRTLTTNRVVLSPQLKFLQVPSIDGDFITAKWALDHPNLECPIAYLNGCELAPLLKRLPAGSTLMQIAQSWLSEIPLNFGMAIACWLFNNGLLVNEPSAPSFVYDLHYGVVEDARS